MSRAAALGLLLALLAAPSAGRAESPRVLYMLHCQGCHLADGTGSPGEVPSLEKVGRFLGTPGGRAYLVQVPGAALSPLEPSSHSSGTCAGSGVTVSPASTTRKPMKAGCGAGVVSVLPPRKRTLATRM